MIRSLAVKLTLAFLAVGVSGAILVAVISGQRTRLEFDRFVADRRGNPVVTDLLLGYFLKDESWDGVERWLDSDPSLGLLGRRVVLASNDQTVIYSSAPEQRGLNAADLDLGSGIPIESGGQSVGTVYLQSRSASGESVSRFSPESFFLRNVNQATALAALIAVLMALVLGFLLSRALTRPLRELTTATEEMSAGQLGKQVNVYSQDEIGQLAASFNQMSSELAKAARLRLQMTADVAHDLRTPLTVLLGYTEGLSDGSIQGRPELYELLHQEVAHLQRLVEDLRTLSLADAGELTLHRRAVDPKALLERAGLAHVVSARQKDISLRVEAPETLPSVAVDVERMTQVLNNLVTNALRFTSEGQIVLSASSRSQWVTLQVADSGTGISPEELGNVFDRFYRGDSSRHRDGQAQSGLGLAIAKAIVEAHDGAIQAESTPGKGTRFSIRLPRTSN